MSALGWISELSSPGELQAAFAQHGPRIASGVLLACLAIEAGVIVTRDYGGGAADAGGSPVAALGGAPQRGPDLRGIVEAHLFGEAPVTPGEAPTTSIPLVLAGVLALDDPSRGMAILGPNAAQAKLYAVGSAVPGGARLHAVYRDRVLLDRGGALETLPLPRKSLAAAPAPMVDPAVQSPAQRLQALAQNNGALLGGLIRAQAVFQQGKLAGYRIFPGNRANLAAFNQTGLHAGDLITAVNGTALDDPNRGLDILQTLSNASTATVTMLRNGATQDVTLNLATVAAEAERAADAERAAEAANAAAAEPAAGAPPSAPTAEQ